MASPCVLTGVVVLRWDLLVFRSFCWMAEMGLNTASDEQELETMQRNKRVMEEEVIPELQRRDKSSVMVNPLHPGGGISTTAGLFY